MSLSDLWATEPPPPSMGDNARAGWDKLTSSFSDWLLGNKTNPDGTITHTTWTGYQLTMDPTISKTFTGSNQVISTGTVPGSVADQVQTATNDMGASVVDGFANMVGQGLSTVANDVSNGLTDNMVHMLVIFGLFGLGAFIIIEDVT